MIRSKEKVTLIEENEIVSNDENTAQVLNTIFSNIVGSLNIPEYVNNDPISDNISDPIIKLIAKYRKHPSILTIGEVCKERKKTCCFFISRSSQDTDIPSKIITENTDICQLFTL